MSLAPTREQPGDEGVEDTVGFGSGGAYILDGLRSLVLANGVHWDELAKALVAIAVVGAISMSMCLGPFEAAPSAGELVDRPRNRL
jgi:hypothetical protein